MVLSWDSTVKADFARMVLSWGSTVKADTLVWFGSHVLKVECHKYKQFFSKRIWFTNSRFTEIGYSLSNVCQFSVDICLYLLQGVFPGPFGRLRETFHSDELQTWCENEWGNTSQITGLKKKN